MKFLQGFNGVSFFPDSEWQDLNTLNFLQIVQAVMIWGVALIFKEVGFFSHGLKGRKIRKF